MASITYDGQSFMIDGRRIWIVSGSVHYARIPRDQWAARIHAARLAGLNTISTPIFWARHEPRQGQFDFTADNDLRHFVQLVHQAGMWCILRPGPYINAGWDLGGLPSWVMALSNVKLRTANPPFLEACSRYITAVAQQVRDLQVTSPGAGGPILLIQNEHAWTCGHDDLAHSYLGELNRYYREAGLTVPTINANDLWQGVEGEIDGWTGFHNLLSDLRQLTVVRPDQPRLVIDFRVGQPDVWGEAASRTRTPALILRRLAEVLAGCGQYNLSPFHGGTHFGFSAGRLPSGPGAFLTTSNDQGAPLTELGMHGAAYDVVKRISTFASRFGRVLANLDPGRQPVVQHPSPPPGSAGSRTAAAPGGSTVSNIIIHVPGSQGSVAFIFSDEAGTAGREREKDKPAAASGRPVTLLLPDGSILPVDLGNQPVAWCLFDTRLTGRTTLDYCNLSAFALLGRLFVCFGPAGTRGMLSINGSRLEADVPEGDDPMVIEHEGMVVVICSTAQVDAAYLDDEALYVGVAGIEPPGAGGESGAEAAAGPRLIPLSDGRHATRISAAGEVSAHKFVSGSGGRGSAGRRRASSHAAATSRTLLGPWSLAPASAYADGSSERYASIAGPADLESLGAPTGYGWYRIRLKPGSARKQRILLPSMRDRAQIIVDGEPAGVVGLGPGAEVMGAISLKKKPQTLVLLAENLGRLSGGLHMTQASGVYGHLWGVSPMRVRPPKLEAGEPVDVMSLFAPLWQVHRGETTEANRITWSFTHRRKSPLFVRFSALPGRGVILVNNTPILPFDSAGVPDIVLDPEALSRGNNTFQLAVLGPPGTAAAALHDAARAICFFEGDDCLTDKPGVEWAFAKWEPPASDGFAPARNGGAPGGVPCWWSCQFQAEESDAPLVLDLAKMSKGQIYINGRHLGRYFVATADGNAVPPQQRYFLPRSFLNAGGGNELLLFDEHGASPAECALIAVH